MSVSIDGVLHKGIINIKYGDEFPIARRSRELESDKYGIVLIYIVSLGRPRWNQRLMVEVPMQYYITQIIEPNKKYKQEKKKKEVGLYVVKG